MSNVIRVWPLRALHSWFMHKTDFDAVDAVLVDELLRAGILQGTTPEANPNPRCACGGFAGPDGLCAACFNAPAAAPTPALEATPGSAPATAADAPATPSLPEPEDASKNGGEA